MQGELKVVQEDISEHAGRLQASESQISNAHHSIAQMEAMEAQLSRDLAALRDFGDTLKTTAMEQANSISHHSAEIKVLQQLSPDLLALRSNVEMFMAQAKADGSKLRSDNELAITQMGNSLEEKLLALRSAVETLEGSVQLKLIGSINELESALNKLRNSTEIDTSDTRNALEKLQQDTEKSIAMLKQEVDQSIVEHRLTEETEFMQLRDKISAVDRDCNSGILSASQSLQSEVDLVKEEMADHSGRLNKAETEISASNHNVAQMQAQADTLLSDVNNLRDFLDGVKGEITEQVSQMAAAESQIAQLTAVDGSQGRDIEDLRGFIDEIKASDLQLSAAIANHTSQLKAVQQLPEDVVALRASLDEFASQSKSEDGKLRSEIELAVSMFTTSMDGELAGLRSGVEGLQGSLQVRSSARLSSGNACFFGQLCSRISISLLTPGCVVCSENSCCCCFKKPECLQSVFAPVIAHCYLLLHSGPSELTETQPAIAPCRRPS